MHRERGRPTTGCSGGRGCSDGHSPAGDPRDERADGAHRTGHDQATDHSHGRCDDRREDRRYDNRDDRRAAGRRQQLHADEPRVVARGDLLTSGWSAAQIDGAARRWRRLLPGVWLVGDGRDDEGRAVGSAARARTGPGPEGRDVGSAARARARARADAEGRGVDRAARAGAGALPGLAGSSGPPIRAHAEAAALSWAGEHAALDASSAARRWGLRYVEQSSVVQVVVAADSPRRSRSSTVASSVAVEVRHSHNLHALVVDGLRVVPPVVAAVQVARRSGDLRSARAVLCEVVQRRMTGPQEVAAELVRTPRNGSALARAAMLDVLAGCRSAPECEIRDAVRASAVLPEPLFNPRLTLADGRRVYPDALWPEAGLVHECDSWEFHDGPRLDGTLRRAELLDELGLLVVSTTPGRLREDPPSLVRRLERHYLARVAHHEVRNGISITTAACPAP